MNLGTNDIFTMVKTYNPDEIFTKKAAVVQPDRGDSASFSDTLRETSRNIRNDSESSTVKSENSRETQYEEKAEKQMPSESGEKTSYESSVTESGKQTEKVDNNSDPSVTNEKPDSENISDKSMDSKTSENVATEKAEFVEKEETKSDVIDGSEENPREKNEKRIFNLSLGTEIAKYRELKRDGKFTLSEILKYASQDDAEADEEKSAKTIVGKLVEANQTGNPSVDKDIPNLNSEGIESESALSTGVKIVNSDGISVNSNSVKEEKSAGNRQQFSESQKTDPDKLYKHAATDSKKNSTAEKIVDFETKIVLKNDSIEADDDVSDAKTNTAVKKTLAQNSGSEKRTTDSGTVESSLLKTGSLGNSKKSEETEVSAEVKSYNDFHTTVDLSEKMTVINDSQDLSKLKDISALLSTLSFKRIRSNYESLQKTTTNVSQFWQNNKISEFKSASNQKTTVKHFIMHYVVTKSSPKTELNLEKSFTARNLIMSGSEGKAQNTGESKQSVATFFSSLKKLYQSDQQTSRFVKIGDFDKIIKTEKNSLFSNPLKTYSDEKVNNQSLIKGENTDLKNSNAEKNVKDTDLKNDTAGSETGKTNSSDSSKTTVKTVNAEDLKANITNISKNISELYTRVNSNATKSESVQIQLTPPNLGKIVLEVVKEDGKISVLIRVENSDAKDMLQKNSHILANRLNNMGIETQKIQIQTQNAEENGGEDRNRENTNQNNQNQEENQKQQAENSEENKENKKREMSFADILKGGN